MRYAGITIVLAALLAGCAAQQNKTFAISPQDTLAHERPLLPGESWMDSRASTKDLVYVSNADGEVTVYDYQTQTLVGVLPNFEKPTGECVDAKGNVYILDSMKKAVYEYAHGGTKAIKTLNDSPYVPNACSVDRVTGNLAVANSKGSGGGANIAVYARAAGKPSLYKDKSISNFAACSYDNYGTLLVTGTQGSSNQSNFAWLWKRGNKLVDITIRGPKSSSKWYSINDIQWDGKFFVLDSYETAYQIALIHAQAYYIGETQLGAPYLENTEYAIYDPNPKQQGTQLLVGYNDQSYGSGVDYFPYPAGGQPDASFTHGVYIPHGVTISLALPKRNP
jgi:hypothetical protein